MKPMEKYKEMFVKYLNQLKDEVKAYPDDGSLWKLSGDIKNTPGNLCLHVCGNLKHNIGTIIGKTGYVRNRDAEFSRKNVPKNKLLNEVDSTIDMISPVIDKLTDDDMKKELPSDTFSQGGSIGLIILRVAAHMGYHLGQINYHRRLISEVK
jgi:hypothetical protein